MKRIILIITVLASFVSTLSAAISPKEAEKALRELDRLLVVRAEYRATRQAHIDSLRLALRGVADGSLQRIKLYEQLGNAYTAFNSDSAIHFYNEGILSAQKLHQDSLATLLNLKRLTLLPLGGFCEQADRMFSQIDTVAMPAGLKIEYYREGAQMYDYIAAFYKKDEDIYQNKTAKVSEFRDRLIELLDPADKLSRLSRAERYFNQGQYAKAKELLEPLLAELSENDNTYARAAFCMSAIAKIEGHRDEQVYYLVRSAIGDIKSATLEVTSLQSLGSVMFEVDDVSRANNYLTAALENAVDCRAMLRINETSEAMPLILEAHQRSERSNHAALVTVMCIMVGLLIGMIVLVIFLRSEMKQMRDLQRGLRDANRIKDVYISQFLNLCSIYMDKLNNFCKIAQRKITAGKVDDLYNMTKSGKFVEEQSREFYEVFDDAFLHIYPTFLKDVNRLLRPDEQIELREGEKLNTDLRILAFMRLGIEESARIAQLLNYSVYTIYTYRNKLKNRAIRRDSFEEDVMRIGSVEL